jgi:hypothetical protein
MDVDADLFSDETCEVNRAVVSARYSRGFPRDQETIVG